MKLATSRLYEGITCYPRKSDQIEIHKNQQALGCKAWSAQAMDCFTDSSSYNMLISIHTKLCIGNKKQSHLFPDCCFITLIFFCIPFVALFFLMIQCIVLVRCCWLEEIHMSIIWDNIGEVFQSVLRHATLVCIWVDSSAVEESS